MSSNDDTEIMNPREMLSNRYKQVIEIQTTSIQNFDDKTWRTMRATGIIAGAGFGGLSLILNQKGGNQILQQPGFQIALSLGVLSFIVSFVLGIRSYQSSKFSTPPWTEIGNRIVDDDPDMDEYYRAVLESYITAIDRNRTTLENKRDRFRLTLFVLFLGIWNTAIASLLLVWRPSKTVAHFALALCLVVGTASGILTLYYDGDRNNSEGAEKEVSNSGTLSTESPANN